jgi:murein DD-endopeptidase MepM/ murein hydrolase activator NlpD
MTSAFVGAGVVALVTGTVMPDMHEPDGINLVDANAVASDTAERSKTVGDDRASRNDTRAATGANTAEIPPPEIYVLPLKEYTLTSKFGQRKLDAESSSRQHTGVDLAAPIGTPFYAVAGGTVILARANGGYGYCIMIDHGGGLISVYGHSSSLAVQEGQTVEAGQTIGYVGDTGYSFGPQLHLEIRVDGKQEDPIEWLKGKGADVPPKTDALTQ